MCFLPKTLRYVQRFKAQSGQCCSTVTKLVCTSSFLALNQCTPYNCTPYQAEGSEDVYHYVQLVRSDSNPDEWLYVQTVTANADTLASSGNRLRPTIELAKQAYMERQSRRAAKVSHR
jgi:hypothetical protein